MLRILWNKWTYNRDPNNFHTHQYISNVVPIFEGRWKLLPTVRKESYWRSNPVNSVKPGYSSIQRYIDENFVHIYGSLSWLMMRLLSSYKEKISLNYYDASYQYAVCDLSKPGMFRNSVSPDFCQWIILLPYFEYSFCTKIAGSLGDITHLINE